MPAIDTAEMERDAGEMQADFPVVCEIDGARITGCKDESEIGLVMADAGYDRKRRMNLTFLISAFDGADVPDTNDEITTVVDGLVWRVDATPRFSPDGINVTFPLVQVT